MNNKVFRLLQFAIGNIDEFTFHLSNKEWNELLQECKLHNVLGVTFSGIQKLPEEQMPPSELLAKWQEDAQKEKERREKVAEICRKACETHEKNGFSSCVLMPRFSKVRGEGVEVGAQSLEVSDERFEVRGGNPRDIDILCWSKEKKDGQRNIIEYVNFQYVASTHHIKPKVVRNFIDIEAGNIPVEVRFKSDYLNCPWYNSRFEGWVREMVERASESGSLMLPDEFFVVYQLLHLYRKLFCEGIRLGHLVEYYYTLREYGDKRVEVSGESLGVRDKGLEIIERLGMKKFAGSVMYVMQTVFAMPDEYLICKPNNRNGSFVLNITMMAGEYTRYIERTRTLKHLGRIGHHLYWLKRNRPFITQYPAEMFFELYKRIRG